MRNTPRTPQRCAPPGLYSYIGWLSGTPIIRYGTTLTGAFALVKEVGNGAIFRRSDGTGAIPVYPLHRRKRVA